MRLSTLLHTIFAVPADVDREIARLTIDSCQIQSHDLFLAIKGTHLDGRRYIPDAISQGAVAILVEADAANASIAWQDHVPIIPIHQLTSRLGQLAARFYDFPAKKLRMIGVTGTSGKTSCTHFMAEILQSLSVPCGLIGTLGYGFYGALQETGLTTPDAISLQAKLAEFVTKGAQAVAMEVSSHSIAQGRINDIEFEIGLFTNLTQDHLDYHGTMQAYAAVKRRFLAESSTRQVIINADDAYGKRWIQELAEQKPVFAYSLHPPSSSQVPAVYAKNIKLSLQGMTAEVETPWGSGHLSLPLIGPYNLSNALAVLTALCLYGIPLQTVLTKLSVVSAVPGRMQMLGGKANQPLVIVDYAHKPGALNQVLQALRDHTQGKLFCVFGCGGERDRGKRPLMAKIAERWADRIIITNDNPRHEEPEAIIADILSGFAHPEAVVVMLDRSKAIENSIQWASAQDCILIAGKGAEHYQQIGDEKIPFDDVEQVSSYLGLGE